MIIRPAGADRFVARPDPAAIAVLIYGPDEGLVRERATTLAKTVVESADDPFRIADLSGEALEKDPARLADEANALSLIGGRRIVRVRGAGDGLAKLFADFLEAGRSEALVIVEAGNLPRTSRLRVLFEKSENAAAIACYADDAETLEALIDRTMAAEKIVLAPEAREFLLSHLGNDRIVTRSELAKLVLYVGPGGRAELADAVAAVGDSAALSLDDVAYAVGGGEIPELLLALDRAFAEDTSPVPILRAVARHFQRLQITAAHVAAGQNIEQAMRRLRPAPYFKLADRFRAQVRRWPEAWLGAAIERLLEAEIQCKSTGSPDRAICTRTLMEIARAGGRRAAG